MIHHIPLLILMGVTVTALHSSAAENSDKTATSRTTNRYLLYGARWDGCSAPQFKPLVDKAADVGFNSIRIVVRWHQHQTKPGEYDFDALDRALDYVVKAKRRSRSLSSSRAGTM